MCLHSRRWSEQHIQPVLTERGGTSYLMLPRARFDPIQRDGRGVASESLRNHVQVSTSGMHCVRCGQLASRLSK